MTTPDNKPTEIVIDLACQFDDQLRSDHAPGNSSVLKNGSSKGQSPADISALSRVERRELEQAKAAVWFLNRVRGDLDQRVPSQNVRTISSGAGSTVNGVPTAVGIPDAINEFDQLGRFQIFETLGQGGFAKVFRAHDPQLDRDVALKIPRPEAMMSDESRTRFDREAKAAAMLSHPAIIPIFETGTIGPITYIACGYCPGQTLSNWFSDRDGSIELSSAAKIVARLAEATQHAHQRGVLHRDLKPANILVEDGDSPVSERVRITDFGLAKIIESDDATITIDGSVVGTPAYMSPEQACGSSELNATSDIFSLGVILYELITGKLPFSKSHHLATLRSIEIDEAIAPRIINESVPKDLEAICLKCLRKSPKRRYQSAFALAEDLNAWLDDRPVTARHITNTERLLLWTKRNSALAASLALALFCLLGGMALTGWQSRVAQNNLAISNVERDRAQKNVQLLQETVEQVLDEYGDSIETDAYISPVHRRIITQMLFVHKQLIDEEAQQLSVTPDTIESYIRISKLHRDMGQLDSARDVCNQADELVSVAIQQDPGKLAEFQPVIVDLLIQKATISLRRGHHQQAEKSLREGVETMRACESGQEKAIVDYRWFKLHRHLGISLLGQRRVKESSKHYEFGKKYANDLLDSDPLNEEYQHYYGVALQDVSNAYRSLGQTEKATSNLENAHEYFSKMMSNDAVEGDYRYRLAFIKSDLGSILSQLDRIDEAENYLDQAETILTELATEQPTSAKVINRLAHTLVRVSTFRESQGQFDEARRANERGLEFVDSMSHNLMTIRNKIHFLLHQGRLNYRQFDEDDDAIDFLQQAIDIGETGVGEFPEDAPIRSSLIESYRHLSILHDGRKNAPAALPLIEKARFHSIVMLVQQPDSRVSQDQAIRQSQYFAKRMGELNKFDEAEQALTELAAASSKSVHVQYQSARYLARLASHRQTAGTPASEILAAKSLAVNQLNKAVNLGFNQDQLLLKQPEWNVLLDSNEFEQIIQSLSN